MSPALPAVAHSAGLLVPAVIAGAGLAAGVLARLFLLPLLHRAAERSSWRYDDVLVDAVRGPVVVWGLLIGLRVALRVGDVPERTEGAWGVVILVLGILSVTWAIARFAGGAVRAATAHGTVAGVSLLANIARAIVLAIGILIVLQTLGISITPIIGALGVGGLAVGLALQPTLGNFFSGIRILAAGKIRPGDYIRLESGIEGVVHDIAWGQTTIRQPANNLVIVPNSKLAEAITVNLSLPQADLSVVVRAGVAYGNDVAQVERVALDVARAVQAEAPGARRDFNPSFRLTEIGELGIQFAVVLRATDWDQQGLLTHEFLKRLLPRLQAEGIRMPPARAVVVQNAGG
jgi:small-conductance mechanosensitive channel